jgi:hypothetical protein
MTLAKTLKIMLDGPTTAQEIAEFTGIHLRTAQEWMRNMKAEGCVHINAWLPDSKGRDSIPVWKLGKGKDKPRHRMTNAETARQYRARKKARALDMTILGVFPNNVVRDGRRSQAKVHKGLGNADACDAVLQGNGD